MLECDLSLCARRVVRALGRVGSEYGLPRSIVLDPRPESRSQALDRWALWRGIELIFMRPGRPIESAIGEDLNGRYRAERLDLHG